MRIAIISDIHSNLAALEAVMSYISEQKVDDVYCLGDIVGYGPYPNECIDLVRSTCLLTVAGNHDFGSIGKEEIRKFNRPGQKVLHWTLNRLTDKNREFLSNLPLIESNELITLVHASLRDPLSWEYIFKAEDALLTLDLCNTQFCFIGHTHLPFIYGKNSSNGELVRGEKYLINVGSTGQPRDGNPDASFGIIDTEMCTYQTMRIKYNIESTANAIIKAGLPHILAQRLYIGY